MKNKSAFLKAKLILASKYASSSWAFFQWSPWDNWCDHIWTEQLWWLYGWCNGSRVTWTSGSLAGTESHATKRETSWVKILTKKKLSTFLLILQPFIPWHQSPYSLYISIDILHTILFVLVRRISITNKSSQVDDHFLYSRSSQWMIQPFYSKGK